MVWQGRDRNSVKTQHNALCGGREVGEEGEAKGIRLCLNIHSPTHLHKAHHSPRKFLDLRFAPTEKSPMFRGVQSEELTAFCGVDDLPLT